MKDYKILAPNPQDKKCQFGTNIVIIGAILALLGSNLSVMENRAEQNVGLGIIWEIIYYERNKKVGILVLFTKMSTFS